MKRIIFLDGLRGVAILLVLLYHAYSRWYLLVPYGNKFASFPIFKFGYLGVHLFFLVSGFVILMSLGRNKNFLQFIYKRWKRLFPAMFISSLIIYSTLSFLPERPGGGQELISVIPGMMFIEPLWIKYLFGFEIKPLEGAFWSLFVEVKFYFIFGYLYFYLGRLKAVIAIVLMFLFSVLSNLFNIKYLDVIPTMLSFEYFGFFSSGALAFLYFKSRIKKYLIYSVAIGMLCVFNNGNSLTEMICETLVLSLFIMPIYFKKLRIVLNMKFLLFLGFISYPLYLIQENAMIALIIKIHRKFAVIPDVLLPVIPVVFLCAVSYFIVKILEPYSLKRISDVENVIKNLNLLNSSSWLSKKKE